MPQPIRCFFGEICYFECNSPRIFSKMLSILLYLALGSVQLAASLPLIKYAHCTAYASCTNYYRTTLFITIYGNIYNITARLILRRTIKQRIFESFSLAQSPLSIRFDIDSLRTCCIFVNCNNPIELKHAFSLAR